MSSSTYIRKDAQNELLVLARRKKNTPLHPEEVVAWAKQNTKSALHDCFEWDNTKAAEKYRLIQARGFIAMIHITPAETSQPMRALVSIMKDRTNGGGYRPLDEVMSDKLMANQIILEALREAKRWSFKYQHLVQLRDIHRVIEKTADKLEPKLVADDQDAKRKSAAA